MDYKGMNKPANQFSLDSKIKYFIFQTIQNIFLSQISWVLAKQN